MPDPELLAGWGLGAVWRASSPPFRVLVVLLAGFATGLFLPGGNWSRAAR